MRNKKLPARRKHILSAKFLPAGGLTLSACLLTCLLAIFAGSFIRKQTVFPVPTLPDLTFAERPISNDNNYAFLHPRFLPQVDFVAAATTTDIPDGKGSDIALDSQGVAHVVFPVTSFNGGFAYYQRTDEVAIRNSFSPGYAFFPGTGTVNSASIAVDTLDNIHVAYAVTASGVTSIRYRKLDRSDTPVDGDGFAWETELTLVTGQQTATVADYWYTPRIAVDSQNNIYVVARHRHQQFEEITCSGVPYTVETQRIEEIAYSKQTGGTGPFSTFATVPGLIWTWNYPAPGPQCPPPFQTPPDVQMLMPLVRTVPSATNIYPTDSSPDVHVTAMQNDLTNLTMSVLYNYSTNAASTWLGTPITAVGPVASNENSGHDLAVFRDANGFTTHFIHWGPNNTIYHKQSANGAQPPADPGTAVNTTAKSSGSSLAQIEVDSRNQPKVVYSVNATDKSGASLPMLCFAAKIGGGSWAKQEPSYDAKQRGEMGTYGMAITERDTVHAIGYSHLHGSGLYTREIEPNLGAQDSNGIFGIAPASAANGVTGNLNITVPLFGERGAGFATAISLVYNSQEDEKNSMSVGWAHNYHVRIIDSVPRYDADPGINQKNSVEDWITLRLGDGRYVFFQYSSSYTYHIPSQEFGHFSRIERQGTGASVTGYKLVTKNNVEYSFNANGKLTQITDKQTTPNTMVFVYSNLTSNLAEQSVGVSEALLTDIRDSQYPTRGATTIAYDSNYRLTQFADANSKTYGVGYTGKYVSTISFTAPTTIDTPPAGAEVGTTQPIWTFTTGAQNLYNEGPSQSQNAVAGSKLGIISAIQTPRATAGSYQWSVRYYQDGRFYRLIEPDFASGQFSIDESGAQSTTPAEIKVGYVESTPGTGEPDPQAVVRNRRTLDTTVDYERRRALVTKVTDPLGKYVKRSFYTGHRNLYRLYDKRTENIYTEFTYYTTGMVPGYVADNLKEVKRPGFSSSAPETQSGFVTTTYEYTTDNFNNVSKITDAKNNVTEYFYYADGTGNLKTVRYSASTVSSWTINTSNNTGTFNQGTAKKTMNRYVWDGRGRLQKSYPATAFSTESETEVPDETYATEYVYATGSPPTEHATGLVRQIKRPDHDALKPEVLDYDIMGDMTSQQMPESGTTTFNYDELYRLRRQVDPSGSQPGGVSTDTKHMYFYTLDSQQSAVSVEGKEIVGGTPTTKTVSTITTFDRLGRAVQVKNPEGNVAKNEYDREWNVRFVRDFKDQLVSERSYTSRGELARAISHQEPAQNAVTVYKQNENSDVTQVIELAAPNNLDEDPANRITTTNYDVRRNAYKSTLADGTYTRTYFDKVDIAVYSETKAPNNVFMSAGATVVGSRGETTKSVSLDDALASSDITWLTGETTGTEPTWTALGIVSYPFYDADLVSIAGRDESSNTSGTSLDRAKRPVYPVDALGKVTGKREYNNDSVTTVVKAQKPDDTNALIAVATNTVNVRGEITQTQDATLYTAKVTHNGFSQAAKLEDRNAATTDIAYDNMLRQYTVTQHVGGTIGDVQLTKFYDANSNLNQINDPRGKSYLFTHSTDNRVKLSTNPVITSGPDVGKQNNEKVRYSALGELLAHQDANGKVACYRNDKLGRAVKEVHVLPNPAMDILAEDDCTFYMMLDYPTAFGELKAQIDTSYQFLLIEDPPGQFKPREVVTKTLTQGSTTVAEEQTTNPQGQLIKERTLVNSSQVFSITYEYNSVGLKSKSVSTNAGTHEYTYDANLRLDLVKRNTTETIADFDYTIGGLKKKVTLLNGVVIDYTYTDRSELKRIVATKSPNTLGDIEITARDGNGNITQIIYHHLSNTTANFTYEAAVSWLKTEEWTGSISYSASYAFDKSGNRISATKGSNLQKMSYDDENRLIEEIFGTSTQVTGHDYQNQFIDVNGNESAQTNPEVCATPSSGIGGPTVRKMTHDNNGSVTKIETLINGGVDLTENLTYAFDNRMIGYTKTGSSSASNTYLFSANRNRINNQNVTANTTEWYYYDGSDVIEEFTQSGAGSQVFANSYVNALGIDSKVCRITSGGTKFYYGQDHIGTNTQTYNSDGTLNSNFVTTAWGETLTGSTTDRYGFTQREKDAESSLNYYRARMYEPKLGRFLGKDALLKQNRFLYASNNPLIFTDPYGMDDWTAENYAKKFKAETPSLEDLSGFEIHHTKQQAMAERYLSKGINVHEGKYLRAAPEKVHHLISKYQKVWKQEMIRLGKVANPKTFWETVDLNDVEKFENFLEKKFEKFWLPIGGKPTPAFVNALDKEVGAKLAEKLGKDIAKDVETVIAKRSWKTVSKDALKSGLKKAGVGAILGAVFLAMDSESYTQAVIEGEYDRATFVALSAVDPGVIDIARLGEYASQITQSTLQGVAIPFHSMILRPQDPNGPRTEEEAIEAMEALMDQMMRKEIEGLIEP